MKIYNCYLIIILSSSLFLTKIHAQSSNPDVSPKWDEYYKNNPSGIEENHQASDFIRIAKHIGYLPIKKEIKGNFDLLERILLSFSQAALKQMMIDGWYLSRTYKHDDYFLLYNKYYKSISKETWDKYCPYILPLMYLDGIISRN